MLWGPVSGVCHRLGRSVLPVLRLGVVRKARPWSPSQEAEGPPFPPIPGGSRCTRQSLLGQGSVGGRTPAAHGSCHRVVSITSKDLDPEQTDMGQAGLSGLGGGEGGRLNKAEKAGLYQRHRSARQGAGRARTGNSPQVGAILGSRANLDGWSPCPGLWVTKETELAKCLFWARCRSELRLRASMVLL